MASGIPKTYSVLFTLLDPLIALWGTSLFLLSPQTVTSSYLPDSYTRPSALDPSTSHPAAAAPLSPSALQEYSLPLHAQIAGHLLSNALLSFLLLRAAPDNLRIWRVYQLSLLLVDGFLLYGTFASYGIQGRLSPLAWRVEDWGAVGITSLAGVARVAFLLRVGFPKRERAKKA
ncbi:beta-mannosidase MndA [Colletotrichum tofieldiae]|uniref:Beta-mannosidase MndA n=1 Tax=Colletotrichum tofieldiae TaxID=708197 RepID=A0A166V4Q8_9PEZI|nr:beta-mannosidase MndA [Colletotrichum tofieldiae]GKT64324.1 beta-mannosidase MndA [Colletotrichum tofieldiae]GKT74298.1 beta-mannosidase MndA [Colletotrichum tofieldiae]